MKNSFRSLYVWQASVDLAVRIVAPGDQLIERRRYGIADQIVRSSMSVPSNIVEGQGRLTPLDRRRDLVQARGSLCELQTQLEVITRAKLAKDVSDVRTLIAKIGAGLNKMIDRLGPKPL